VFFAQQKYFQAFWLRLSSFFFSLQTNNVVMLSR
jgi:hypothetical protein